MSSGSIEQVYEMREDTLELNGVKLAYRACVIGQPKACILFTHGLGVNSETYLRFAKQIAMRGYLILVPDLRGEGRSDGKTGDVDYIGQHRDDLQSFFHHIRAQHPSLPLFLGAHSVGCSIMMQLPPHIHAEAAGIFYFAPVWMGYVDYMRKYSRDFIWAERLRYCRNPAEDSLPPLPKHNVGASIRSRPFSRIIGKLLPRLFGGITVTVCKLTREVGMAKADGHSQNVQHYSYRHSASIQCPALTTRISELRKPVMLVVGGNDEYIQPSAVVSMFHWNLHPSVPFQVTQIKRADHTSLLITAGLLLT